MQVSIISCSNIYIKWKQCASSCGDNKTLSCSLFIRASLLCVLGQLVHSLQFARLLSVPLSCQKYTSPYVVFHRLQTASGILRPPYGLQQLLIGDVACNLMTVSLVKEFSIEHFFCCGYCYVHLCSHPQFLYTWALKLTWHHAIIAISFKVMF